MKRHIYCHNTSPPPWILHMYANLQLPHTKFHISRYKFLMSQIFNKHLIHLDTETNNTLTTPQLHKNNTFLMHILKLKTQLLTQYFKITYLGHKPHSSWYKNTHTKKHNRNTYTWFSKLFFDTKTYFSIKTGVRMRLKTLNFQNATTYKLHTLQNTDQT